MSILNTVNKRKEALSKLVQIKDEEIPSLIKNTDKSYWGEAVKVISEIGSPRNYIAIPELISLLQDLNWPGADEALKIMESMDKKIFIPYIEKALKEAENENDDEWIAGIKYFVIMKALNEDDFSNNEVYKILEQAAW
ncbi:DUF5071 domain-containing protein [Clostridium felsineum]|uniref:DUF5071 domain-containing protein n=1 Tax=Clostridium felsineum TaxID=36839 RepID=UPI00098CB93E|nr:DUF5071 domain-containing protein [Clostridium felsineum]URZ15657.1 hypothetical protein CLFE_017030 [Clostridium felsineum DSM 794]